MKTMFNAVHFVSDDMQHNNIPKKRLTFASVPPIKYTLGDRAQAFKLKSPLICFIYVLLLSCMQNVSKILTAALVISKFKFKYLTFDP